MASVPGTARRRWSTAAPPKPCDHTTTPSAARGPWRNISGAARKGPICVSTGRKAGMASDMTLPSKATTRQVAWSGVAVASVSQVDCRRLRTATGPSSPLAKRQLIDRPLPATTKPALVMAPR